MTGQVSIANRALTKIGAARITDLADDTEEARTVSSLYEAVRDAELRRRKWRFSLKRASLAADADDPPFGYGNQFTLPTDCLRVLSVGNTAPGDDLEDIRGGLDQALWSVEGRKVLTNLPAPLNMRYIRQVTDETQMDSAFVEALASRLAYELADRISGAGSRKEEALRDYRLTITEAIQANALESASESLPDDSWLMARA